MSTLRNTATRLWRGGLIRKANVILGVTGAALSAACAAEQAVAPAATPQAQRASTNVASPNAAFDAGRDAQATPTDKAAKDAANQVSKAQFDSLKADWKSYTQALKSGFIVADFVRCEPKPSQSQTKVIGPKGGKIDVGPHHLVVPAGALDSNVTITATAPTASVAELRFEPHGLHFNAPVEMTISYKGCIAPTDAVLGVSYVTHPVQSAAALKGKSDERMPAHDDKASTAISALTDHFSGYMVTWTR